MKQKTFLIVAIALVTIAACTATFTGCKQTSSGDTVSQCMASFKTAVNASNWSALKDLTHPDATKYNVADATFWSTYFLGTDFTYTVSGSTASATCASTSFTFNLETDSDDNYRVTKIYQGSATDPFFY